MSDINTLINSNSLHAALSQNFYKVNALEMEPTTQNIEDNIFDEDLIMVIDNLVNLYLQEINKGKEENVRKKFVLDYFNYYKINLQKMYHWLVNNQTCSNSIYLLGYFNYYGIETDINKYNAFNIYQKAAELGNIVVQYDLANMYIDGEGSDKDYEKAFELSKKLTEGNNTCGINLLGYCYECNIGTDVNEQKAFEFYQNAADLGNIFGMYNLGRCYKNGFGTSINNEKAFELFQRAANFEYNSAQQSLAWINRVKIYIRIFSGIYISLSFISRCLTLTSTFIQPTTY
ncbi:kinase-like domain-containing protein [Rhizophagus irregularis DAOM 181602=DAOM 197198]|nr:kinase-like domain-containing protein [Rhizophagus irregularis DAOM 181602=DAOM 197198]